MATAGFTDCDLGDLHIDEYDGQTRHPYLSRIADKRCDSDETLASYCINEQYHGLAVRKIAVPKTTFPVFALYFDADLTTARAALKRALGAEFRPSEASELGTKPELIKDPADPHRSVLICTKQF